MKKKKNPHYLNDVFTQFKPEFDMQKHSIPNRYKLPNPKKKG